MISSLSGKISSLAWRLAPLIAGSPHKYSLVTFESGGAIFQAYIPSSELWVAVKDVLIFEVYECLPDFRLSWGLDQDSLLVDAGAHAGLFSLKASPFCRKVVAIEPNPANYRLLQTNIRLNMVN
jgi:hypothetical protein